MSQIKAKSIELINGEVPYNETGLTGIQMYNSIIDHLGLLEIDITADPDFASAYRGSTGIELKVAYYWSLFQRDLFLWALQNKHGPSVELDKMYHQALAWNWRLRDKINVEGTNRPLPHLWSH